MILYVLEVPSEKWEDAHAVLVTVVVLRIQLLGTALALCNGILDVSTEPNLIVPFIRPNRT